MTLVIQNPASFISASSLHKKANLFCVRVLFWEHDIHSFKPMEAAAVWIYLFLYLYF